MFAKNIFCNAIQYKKIWARIKNPPLSTRYVQQKEINKMLHTLGAKSKVLNIGSKDTKYSNRVINMDIVKSPNVDVIGDAHTLPFSDLTFDGIIITAVLEIVENPLIVVSEIYRILKNGGIVIATLPFLQPYHPDPHDFRRFTEEGVEYLFSKLKKITIRNTRGIFSMFIWILRDFLATVLSFNNVMLWRILKIIFGWLLFPFKYIDYILPNYKKLYYISSSFLYVGRKQEKDTKNEIL